MINPPRCTRVLVALNFFKLLLSALTVRESTKDDLVVFVRRQLSANMFDQRFEDIGLHLDARTSLVHLRNQPIKSQGASHRFFLGPNPHDPDRNTGCLKWARQHRSLIDLVVTTGEAVALAFP